ncbi:attachment protein [Arsenophonus sp. PmNCSU2021_1]|uniref:attachment protein n=1 Tax=Arsenophonus sp. PmNCSU2021_1 TaxID=3118989 RepID=UPI002FEEAC1C
MNNWPYIFLLFSISFFAHAEWETSYHELEVIWDPEKESAVRPCAEAKDAALDFYESVKDSFVNQGYQIKYELDKSCKVPSASKDLVYVKWGITVYWGKDDEKDCLAKPIEAKTYANAYKIGSDYYVNIEGCQYIATGTIVPIGDTVAADWKPTGKVLEEGKGKGSGGNEGGSSPGGGSGGNEGSGSVGGGSGGNDLDEEDDIASAVETALKKSLIEEYDSGKDTSEATKKTDESLKSISGSFDNLLRGAGNFADPDTTLYGQGESVFDTAVKIASPLEIKEGSFWRSIFSHVSIFPNGQGCSDFILFADDVYEIRIGCDKLTAIKSLLSWVMAALTFWYVFTSLTSLLRKGGD